MIFAYSSSEERYVMKFFQGCFLSACALTFLAVPVSAQSWPEIFEPDLVLTLNFELDDADLDTIRHDTTNEIEVPAWFYADGEEPILVLIRRKSSRALPSESNPIKVSWKVDLNDLVDGQKWHGLTKLSLENGADTDPISEGLAWNLHEMASVDGFYGAGYHAGLANWVRVVMNGEYVGVYANVEQRDKQFLRNRGLFFGDSRTWLYEIDEHSAGWFELEVGEPHSPLWNELSYSPFRVGTRKVPVAPTPSDAVLATELPAKIDMQSMLTLAAVDAFSSNNDATFTHGKNFRFVDFDPALGLKRMYFPWDLDAAVTDRTANIYAQKLFKGKTSYAQTEYQRVILNHPGFREQYNAIMSGLLDPDTGPLSETAIHVFLDGLETTSLPAALAADPYAGFNSLEAVSSLFDGLRSWVTVRIGNVLGQVAANQPPPRSP
jgi:hypothetical protein